MSEIESRFQIYKVYVLKFFITMSNFIFSNNHFFQENDKVYVFVGSSFEVLNDSFEIQSFAGMQRTYNTSATLFFKNKISNF